MTTKQCSKSLSEETINSKKHVEEVEPIALNTTAIGNQLAVEKGKIYQLSSCQNINLSIFVTLSKCHQKCSSIRTNISKV